MIKRIIALPIIALAAGITYFIYTKQSKLNSHITTERARTIADMRLQEDSKIEWAITRMEQRDFGWIIDYTPKKYEETKNLNDLIPGRGPLIVNFDGSSIFLPSAHSELEVDNYGKFITHKSESIGSYLITPPPKE